MASPLALAIQSWELGELVNDEETEIKDIMRGYIPGIPNPRLKQFGIDVKNTPHRRIKTNIPLPLIFQFAMDRADKSEMPYYHLLSKKNLTLNEKELVKQFFHPVKKGTEEYNTKSIPKITVQTQFVSDINAEPRQNGNWFTVGELPTNLGMASQVYLTQYGNPLSVRYGNKYYNPFKYFMDQDDYQEIWVAPTSNGTGFNSESKFYYQEGNDLRECGFLIPGSVQIMDEMVHSLCEYRLRGIDNVSPLTRDWFKLTTFARVPDYIAFLYRATQLFEGIFVAENFKDSVNKVKNALEKWNLAHFEAEIPKSANSDINLIKRWKRQLVLWSAGPQEELFLMLAIYALGRRMIALADKEFKAGKRAKPASYTIVAYFRALGILIGHTVAGYGFGLTLDAAELMNDGI